MGFEPCTRWPGPTPDPLGHGAQTQMKGRLFEENAPDGGSLEETRISQTYPFLVLSALKTSKKGRFEKLVGKDFSNPPLFESFSPENLKKRVGLRNLGFSGIRTLYPLARTNTRSVRSRGPNSNERPPF